MLHADARFHTAAQCRLSPCRPRRIYGILPRRDRTNHDVEHAARTLPHRHCKPRNINGRFDSTEVTSGLSNSQIASRCRRIPDKVGCSEPSAPGWHGIPCLSYCRYTCYRYLRNSGKRKWRPYVLWSFHALRFLLPTKLFALTCFIASLKNAHSTAPCRSAYKEEPE